MCILFVIPPSSYNQKKMFVDRVYGCNYGYDYKPAIHFLLSATIFQNAGYKVRFLDCPAEGLNAAKFEKFISQFRFDVAVFFSVYLSKQEDLTAANLISKVKDNIKIIFLGSYPTWRPDEFIKNKNFYVIRGEPENTFKDFIQVLKEGCSIDKINGISYMKNGKLINNPIGQLQDLNNLPIPDRRLLQGQYYFHRLHVKPSTIIFTTRGCSYNCVFCAPNAIDQAIELEYKREFGYKPPLRFRSTENVIKEFYEIAKQGYKGVEICDNQFIWDKNRTIEICNAVKPLKLNWLCNARADYLKDKEMLTIMKEAGCKLIYIGTESFNQMILDDLRKDLRVEDNTAAVDMLKEVGIMPQISVLMGGSVNETVVTIQESLSLAKRIKPGRIHYSVALPLPNTELYDIAKQNRWFRYGEFEAVDNTREAIVNLPNINHKELNKLLKKIYIKQYFAPKFIFFQLFNRQILTTFKHKVLIFIRLLQFLLYTDRKV